MIKGTLDTLIILKDEGLTAAEIRADIAAVYTKATPTEMAVAVTKL